MAPSFSCIVAEDGDEAMGFVRKSRRLSGLARRRAPAEVKPPNGAAHG